MFCFYHSGFSVGFFFFLNRHQCPVLLLCLVSLLGVMRSLLRKGMSREDILLGLAQPGEEAFSLNFPRNHLASL